MKAKLIKIGNSLGIRIPKTLIMQAQLSDEVEIEQIERSIVIRPIDKEVRKGWDDEFKKMAENGDDYLLLPITEIINEFDDKDWIW